MALEEFQSENMYDIVVADVRSAASAPTVTATPRFIPTVPPKLLWGAVPSACLPVVLALKLKSSLAVASTSAKTVAFAAPFRIVTPKSMRGTKWAVKLPIKLASEAPTLTWRAIWNMLAERKMDRKYRAGLTRILRLDVGGACTRRGGESKLHLRHVERGTERQISYNVEVGFCTCVDGEDRPDSEYSWEIKTRKANFEDLDVWSCYGALGTDGNIESSRSGSCKTTSESLLTLVRTRRYLV